MNPVQIAQSVAAISGIVLIMAGSRRLKKELRAMVGF